MSLSDSTGMSAAALSRTAMRTASTDDAKAGDCGLGVRRLCEALKLPFTQGHGYQWAETLPKNGWKEIKVRPEDAPPGAILVYDRVRQKGGTPGERFGHVEMVAYDYNKDGTVRLDKDGKPVHKYVAGAIADHPGGSDPTRPLKVFVHPSMENMDPMQAQRLMREGGVREDVSASLSGWNKSDLSGLFNDGSHPLMALVAFIGALAGVGNDPQFMESFKDAFKLPGSNV